MPQVYGDKIKGLKDFYNFRLMLKAKVVAYKKAIGHDPDFEQLKQVLYACMDMQSKNLASQSGLDRRGYAELVEDIDRRYRLQYEGLDFGKTAKLDDPIGLGNLHTQEGEPSAEEGHYRNACHTASPQLKGKGKGGGAWNPKVGGRLKGGGRSPKGKGQGKSKGKGTGKGKGSGKGLY